MDGMDYKPNSNKYKEEQKKPVQKISGTAKTKKKSDISGIASVFISEDIHNVKDYLVRDMLVPTIKKAILGALDMILNGDSRGAGSRFNEPKVSYRQYYKDPRDDYPKYSAPTATKRFDYDEIIFETRGDAELVLTQMIDTIMEYKLVTVAAFYEMARLEAPFTSEKYGWTDLRNASVERYRDGYILKLPKAAPID